MKVLMVARVFPAYHIRKGQPTFFVEQILNEIHRAKTARERMDAIVPAMRPLINDFYVLDGGLKKPHTIRAGTRFKAGDMASLRVWSDKPYRSKQIEFAQVEIKRVYPVQIFAAGGSLQIKMNSLYTNNHELIARNDGLSLGDFIAWFAIHPKKKKQGFTGQIICWGETHY